MKDASKNKYYLVKSNDFSFNDNESVRLRNIVLDEKDSMTIGFDIWNSKQWEDSNVPYPFYRSENEELFLEVLEEIENISELKPFVEYF